MDTRAFIDSLASGNAAEAKETLSNLISAKAFDALEAKKVEIAQNLFRDKDQNQEDTEEVQGEEQTEEQ
jgi:hypothetical protein